MCAVVAKSERENGSDWIKKLRKFNQKSWVQSETVSQMYEVEV